LRDIEVATTPVRPGVVDPDHRGATGRGVVDQQNCPIWKVRAGGIVRAVGAELFAGTGQAAGIVSVLSAVPIVGRFELQGFANQRPRFAETFDPMADALIAVLAARRLGLSLIWRRESQ